MPTVEQIRTAIANKIAAVADVGQVHAWQRYAQNNADFRALYVATIAGAEQLRGWHVRRVATDETSDARGRYVVTHRWEIRGYMGLDDGAQTERTFDTLIEALRDAFRDDETLGGLVSSTVIDEGAGLQLDEHVPVMFAGTLAHMARLTLYTRHYV